MESSAEGLQGPNPSNSRPTLHLPLVTELHQPCAAAAQHQLRTREKRQYIPKGRLGQNFWLPTPLNHLQQRAVPTAVTVTQLPVPPLSLCPPDRWDTAGGHRDIIHPNRSCSHHHQPNNKRSSCAHKARVAFLLAEVSSFLSFFFFPPFLWPYPQMLRARGNYLLLTLKQEALRPQGYNRSPYHYFLLFGFL